MTVGSPKPVPALAPSPPKHSLVLSAVLLNEQDEAMANVGTPDVHEPLVLTEAAGQARWLAGIAWFTELCGLKAHPWDPCPVDEAGNGVALATKSDPIPDPEEQQFSPFTIEMESAINAAMVESEVKARALRQLEAATPWAVEAEFWNGTLRPDGSNFALVQVPTTAAVSGTDGSLSNGVLAGGAAVTPGQAIALLTQALASSGAGARGMIHAPAALVDEWAAGYYLDSDGPRYVTRARGDVVVAHGFPGVGVGPTGAANRTPSNSSWWAYATRMVGLRLSDATVYAEGPTRSGGGRASRQAGSAAGALDPLFNRWRYRAEREAAFQVDPCGMFAVRVQGMVP